MKIQDMRKKSDQELGKHLSEFRESVRELRFKVAAKEIKNHQLLKAAKKDIAKVLTVLKERENAK